MKMATNTNTPPPGSSASLQQRMLEISERRKPLIAQIIEAEKTGATAFDSVKAGVTDAAAAMLSGASPRLPKSPAGDPVAALKALRDELAVIDRALVLAEQLHREAQIAEGAQRFQSRRGDWLAAMNRIAQAIVELEHAQQARDAIARDIRSSAPLPGENYPLLGRFSQAGSPAYRFIQTAAVEGWLTHAEFSKEIENARK
jgi:hypothetical protein